MTNTPLSILERIATGTYKVPYEDPPSESREARAARYKAHAERADAMYDRFKADLLEENGLTGHPRADRLFRMAYDRGSGDLTQIVGHFEELAQLLEWIEGPQNGPRI